MRGIGRERRADTRGRGLVGVKRGMRGCGLCFGCVGTHVKGRVFEVWVLHRCAWLVVCRSVGVARKHTETVLGDNDGMCGMRGGGYLQNVQARLCGEEKSDK